jgi:hypothetical protein
MRELQNLVTIKFSHQHAQEHWRAFNRAPNFLKHADRDWNTSLVESDANPEHVIRYAIVIYLDLMGYMTPEMQVWFVLQCVAQDTEFKPEEEPYRGMAQVLKAAPANARGAAALELISNVKRPG